MLELPDHAECSVDLADGNIHHANGDDVWTLDELKELLDNAQSQIDHWRKLVVWMEARPE